MTKSPNKSNNYGQQISYERASELLNNLTKEEQGVLLDCAVSQNQRRTGQKLTKPLPFLQTVNLEEELMIIILEYKLYLPDDSEERELALEVEKNECQVYKEEEELNFVFEDEEVISIQLHNSYEFPHYLQPEKSLPTYPFLEWVTSPFI